MAIIAATPKPAHSMPGPTAAGRRAERARPSGRADGRHQHQPEQADAAIDQDDGRRQRLRAGGRAPCRRCG